MMIKKLIGHVVIRHLAPSFFSNIILARSLGNPRSVPDQATSRTFYKSARIRVHSFLPDQNVIRVLRWLLDDGTD